MTRLFRLIFLCILLGFSFLSLLVATEESTTLAAARRLFSSRDFVSARKILEPLAKSGQPEAQRMLGEMFAEGFGTPQDYEQAYAWYSLAAAQMDSASSAALDALTLKMTIQQVARAQALASTLGTIDSGGKGDATFLGAMSVSTSSFSCAFGGERITTEVYTFRAGATANQMVFDILYYSGLKPNFEVRAANVGNAAALIETDGAGVPRRYILYNPSFMEQVERSTRTDWAAYSIMAHEIGHHLQGHTIQHGGSRPDKELEADEFSGHKMAQMGATIEEAQAAMNQLGSETGSSTHPAKVARLGAITRGWHEGKKIAGASPRPPLSSRGQQTPIPGSENRPKYPVPETPSAPQPYPRVQVATVCATMYGACPMRMPLPVGAACFCMAPNGAWAPGAAR